MSSSAMEFEAELEKRGAPFKYGLVGPYLHKFPFEDREHVPNSEYYDSSDDEDDEYWGLLKFRPPNAHEVFKRFLKQVRESNGYDVDCCPPPRFFSPFMPKNPKSKDEGFRNDMMRATQFAIDKINVETGKTYVLVEIEKVIDTTSSLLLLTFTVKEEADSDVDAQLKTLRAMVNEPYSGSLDYELEEWMFKPPPPATEKPEPKEKKAKIGEGTSNVVTLNTLEASMLEHIFSSLDDRSAVNLALTCQRLRSIWASLKKSSV